MLQKRFGPFLFPEAGKDTAVLQDDEGPLDQHSVGGQKPQLLFFGHGGQLILQLQAAVTKPLVLKNFFRGREEDAYQVFSSS